MRSPEFASAYPSELPPRVIHSGPHSHLIELAQDWSYRFGQSLHRLLTDGPSGLTAAAVEEMNAYIAWAKAFSGTEYELMTEPNGLRARNEVNFNLMNAAMVNLWPPLFNGSWASDNERIKQVAYSQRTLAFSGTVLFNGRQAYAGHQGEDALYQAGLEQMIATLTGVMQEYDAAIILLDIIRQHPNLTLVPAPLQFERTRRQTNVDFVLVDVVHQQTVGIQVKTAVRQSHLDQADAARVVFVDGTVDLENVKAVRTRRGSSNRYVKPWPGLISAHYISTLKAKGTGPERMSRDELGSQQRLKLSSAPYIQGITVDRREIVSRITDRIFEKLYA